MKKLMQSQHQPHNNNRILVLDTLRGIVILSMIGFHACYDMAYILGWSMPWFTVGPFQNIWRCSISWTFLLLAGWMTSCSRNNAKRALKYAAAALLVFIATTIASVDTAVNFGIIFCMAASTAVYALIKPVTKNLRTPVLASLSILLLILFLALQNIPHTTYEIEGFAWLGFPSPNFSSGDYYPMIPYTFLYLAGAFAAQGFSHARTDKQIYPAWMYNDYIHPLTVIGQHSLIIYLVHQPILMVIFMLIGQM